MSILDSTVPIYRFFEEISAVPRSSHEEGRIADYLAAFAKARKLRCLRDETNNVVIYKPGSKGREQEAPVMLQSHIDMVCEKNGGTDHDFSADPIRLIVEDGWLRADGTTLGADDGAGVSYMLAILDSDSLSHPPLECVFTAAEEVGMDGARALRKDAVSARRMIGLDGHGETLTYVSSSGGRRIRVVCPVSSADCSYPTYTLTVTGLKGGHSGALIEYPLGNAIKLGFRLLYRLLERGADVRIVRIAGGLKNNAIPREFAVQFASAAAEHQLRRVVEVVTAELREELGDLETALAVELTAGGKAAGALTPEDSGALISLGYLLPNGLRSRSVRMNIPLVSMNLGVMTQDEEAVTFDYLLRSPIQSARDDMTREIEAVGSIFGAYVQVDGDYNGWNYSAGSPLREALRSVLQEKGQELREEASHGGLETGVFKGRYPQLDIITYGPITEGIHSPDERLDLASFLRSYENLTRLLELI